MVRTEPLQGKGNVVRRMFADIEADVYVLVDGDDTYDAPSAPLLISKLVDEQLDMVNGARVTEIVEAYRPGHRFGNMMLTGIVAKIFGNRVADMLSGYRVFSRRFVKSFPALSGGFEIETELTVHALELRMPMSDVDTPYKDRPPGSASKLRTYYDGFRILKLILVLVKEERPLQFFSLLSAAMAFIALVLAWPVLVTFLQTGLVPRLPTAVLSTGLMLLAFLSLTCGLILETVTRGRREIKRMQYLRIPAPGVRARAQRRYTRCRNRKMIRRLFSAELIKFGIVGVVGLGVDIAVLYLCLDISGLGLYASRVVSYLAAATTTWALNRAFTFSGNHAGKIHHQWARFVAVNAFGGAVNYAVYAALVASGDPFTAHPALAVAAGSLSGLFFNFTASKKLVFRRA